MDLGEAVKRRRTVGCLCGAGLMVVLGVVWLWYSGERELNRVAAELEQAGEPLTWKAMGVTARQEASATFRDWERLVKRLGDEKEVLKRAHMLPKARPLIRPGVALLTTGCDIRYVPIPSVEPAGKKEPSRSIHPPKVTSWPALIAAWRPIRTLMDEAWTLRVRADWVAPRELDRGMAAKWPYLASTLKFADTLKIDSLVALHEGDAPRLRRAHEAFRRLATLSESAPILLVREVELSISRTRWEVIWQQLESGVGSDADLEHLAHVLEEIPDFLGRMIRDLRGERVRVWITYDKAFRNPTPSDPATTLEGLFYPLGSAPRFDYVSIHARMRWQRDLALICSYYQECIRRIQAQREDLDYNRLNSQIDPHSDMPADLRWMNELGLNIMFIPQRPLRNIFIDWAEWSMARAAVALERHRRATGRFPARLDDLCPTYLPSVPVDPFDGQPLRYRAPTGPGRYTLYSVGRDGVDSGGDRMPPGRAPSYFLWDGNDLIWPQSVDRVED